MRPFNGITVIDLTHVLAGPYCAYQLALLGADVVKVESPDTPDVARGRGRARPLNAAGLGLNYQVQGSNKRAIALDLAARDGREAFLRLVDHADVLVVNLRPGAMERLDLATTALRVRNPRLIVCTISGYGDATPLSSRSAYDNIIQAASGMMSQTGGIGSPVKTAASVVDYATGMSAAFAIAAAVLQRTQTGVGQSIDCAMLDVALSMMAPEIAGTRWHSDEGATPPEAGLATYPTADGLLMLGAFNPRQNQRLWKHLGHEGFAALNDWEQLWTAADAMRVELAIRFREKSARAWELELNDIGVPAQRVATLGEAIDNVDVGERGFLTNVGNVTVPLAPFRFAKDGPRIDSPPPSVGADTRNVLEELGFAPGEIDAMFVAGHAR